MAAHLTLEEQLALASEFLVPIPQGPAGGYGEIVVRRDRHGDGWAVTDGAVTGLRAWTDGVGWQYVSDIGRVGAYRYTREEALELAHQVAELEAAHFQALLALAANPFPNTEIPPPPTVKRSPARAATAQRSRRTATRPAR